MKRETCIVILKMEEITLKNTYFLSHKLKIDYFQPHLYVVQKITIKAIFSKRSFTSKVKKKTNSSLEDFLKRSLGSGLHPLLDVGEVRHPVHYSRHLRVSKFMRQRILNDLQRTRLARRRMI
jgi:hypothetical protein